MLILGGACARSDIEWWPLALLLAGTGLLLALRTNLQKACAEQDAQQHHASPDAMLAPRRPGDQPAVAFTRLNDRSEFVRGLEADIATADACRLLAVIRLRDFDKVASFDRSQADSVLNTFLNRLRSALHSDHPAARVDRDSIGIWFQGAPELDAAYAELRSLIYVAGQELQYGAQRLVPTLEIGCAEFPRDGRDPQQLLAQSVANLQLAKPAFGKVTRSPASPQAPDARAQFVLEQDLARAISENQLRMVFQPVVSLSWRRIVGAEALLRWTHPILGPIPPVRFIPIMENTGLSERFGLWVLNSACREARRWREAGATGLTVAVNLSARQLLDPDLETKVQNTVDWYRLGSSALELELTETAAMADISRTQEIFERLHAIGVSLAIDDFGSGYSSLQYLKQLPFDKLKIDREFVTDVDKRPESQAICKALIDLGANLNLKVLAEGVEKKEEVEYLSRIGCDLFQGYFFAKPLTGDDFLNKAAVTSTALANGWPCLDERRIA